MAQTTQKSFLRRQVLNDLEYKVASVACDLLEKGEPTTRIARYAIEQKMTPGQMNNFIQKLKEDFMLPKWLIDGILERYRLLLAGGVDDSIINGRALRNQLERLNEV